MGTTRARHAERLIVTLLIFLGFAARVWRLGFQSIWLDEGLSVSFAGRPLIDMFSTLIYQDLHPPLFYLVLHFWMQLAGQSEFAVRFVALWLGLPAVPATYVLGLALFAERDSEAADGDPSQAMPPMAPTGAYQRFARTAFGLTAVHFFGAEGRGAGSPTVSGIGHAGSSPVPGMAEEGGASLPNDVGPRPIPGRSRGVAIGAIGAFLVAFSPFLVYYSQEARMYSALASFSVLSTYALWKLLANGERNWLVAYVAFTSALLYTQYFGGLVIGFQVLYLLGLATWRRRRALPGFLGMLLAGVLYLPWVPAADLQIQRLFHVPDFWRGELSLTFLLEHVLAAFALGEGSAFPRFLAVAIIAVVVLFVGLIFLARRALRHGGGELYVLAYLLVPLSVLYAVLVKNPKFTERYLIMIAPAFYLVLALGLVDFTRWTGRRRRRLLRWLAGVPPVAVALVLVGASLSQLWQVYYGPGYRKEDNRGATAYIEQHYQPGDVVILMMDPFSFPYYSHGKIPSVQFQPGNNVVGAAGTLNAILAGHKRAWLLLWNQDWADPTGYARHALQTAYPRLPVNRQFNGLGLELYAIDHPPHFQVRTTPEHPAEVNFGNRLSLLGYDLPKASIPAGQSGDVTFYWKPLTSLDHDYIVSLRLTDGRFYYWRHDGRPAAETYPTTSWPVGQTVAGDLSFQVPIGTPPGTYALEVGVYGQGVNSDLDVLKDGKVPTGTAVKVATIDVTRPAEPPDPTKLGLKDQRNVAFGSDLLLLGSTFQAAEAPPGGSVDLALWWQARQAPLPSYQIQLSLQNGSYRRTIASDPPVSGRYPTSQWRDGEVVEDLHRLVVPADAPPGLTHVWLRVVRSDSGAPVQASTGDGVDLGSFTVQNRLVQLTPPARVGRVVDWRFGTFAQLVGYSVDTTVARAGDHLHLTLYWKALGNSGDVGYTVFAHLLDNHSIIWAQQDHPPGGGANPTSGWITGEYVADNYDLAIKPDAKPGSYQIEVGMYNPTTGVRLPVRSTNGQDDGDRVILATIQVK